MSVYKELQQDLNNDDLPSNLEFYNKIKCKLISGKIVFWYFKDEEKFYKENETSGRKEKPYGGIIVPKHDLELRSPSSELEAEDCVLIMTEYPVEKEYCESTWMALKRLLDNPELVEIFD